jgi:hypothetical protein
VASHRMHDADRPRRPVPAWVTAPYVDGAQGTTVLEAPPAPATTAPAAPVAGSAPRHGTSGPVPAPAPLSAHEAEYLDVVVPDHMPSEEHLPPAPTSPTVHTRPFDRTTELPAPVSRVDAGSTTTAGARAAALVGAGMSAPVPTGVHSGPIAPRTGQPRFSVPGLEHIVVEGAEPEPSGPVGYRTPRRFAHQQGAVAAAAAASAPTTPFDQVIAAPTADAPSVSAPLVPGAETAVTGSLEPEPSLPADAPATPTTRRRTAIGATPGAVLGAVAALATIGLAAWWFTAPATVHVVGLVLGVVALVCSVATLRKSAVTWQRPVALLGAVLGGVGTLVLLWAVASAVLPMAGVTLPDLTGTGVVPTLAP